METKLNVTQPNGSSDCKLLHLQTSNTKLELHPLRSYLRPGILDFYILRQFFWVLFAILFLISIFYILMDFLNCSDTFFQVCKENNASVLSVMFGYYTPRLLALYDSLLSTFILFSGLITFMLMSGRNEAVALSCMGIPRSRAIYMIIIASLILTAFGAFSRECILPANRKIINGDIKSYFSQNEHQVESKTDPLTQIHISGESLDMDKKAIIKPIFDMPQYLDKYGIEIRAEIAIWQPPQLGDGVNMERSAGFLLQNVSSKVPLDKQSSLYAGETPVLYTPLNHSWLKSNECFLASGIDIEDLAINSDLKAYCTIPELQRIMKRMPLTQRAKAALAIHSRLAKSFLDVCIILIGLTFIMKRASSVTLMILRTIMLCLLCWILIQTCLALGGVSEFYLAPAISAWVPLIVLGGILTYLWNNGFC